MTASAKTVPLSLRVEWRPEPDLAFAGGLLHIDPKVGIPVAGPRSLGTARHRPEITTAFIGTGEGISRGQAWFGATAQGVDGDDSHAPFPGFGRDIGFRTTLRTDDPFTALIGQADLRALAERNLKRERFEALLALIDDRVAAVEGQDAPADIAFLVLPDDLYRSYHSVKYMKNGVQVVRNLRTAIKALAMRRHVRTQILLESTLVLGFDRREDLDHPADLAWNLYTGIYFKSGGLPWAPVGIPPGTCHIGVTFYRPHGERSEMRTSVAHAFTEHGDAFVLRGGAFRWEGKWPHLPAEEAERLSLLALDRYKLETGRAAARVVVHKQSRFFDEERAGFEAALKNVRYDLVALARSSAVRLMRHGQYPPPRGAVVTVGTRRYLYTTGYLPEAAGYPHGHVPAPLQITDHVGDTAQSELLDETLLLTKMNPNSARYAERDPITIRFAGEVGSILRDIPEGEEPEARYPFYM